MKRLKDDLHEKSYPRRFRLEVANRDPLFFHARRYLRFSLFGGENRLCRNVAIAAIGMLITNILTFLFAYVLCF